MERDREEVRASGGQVRLTAIPKFELDKDSFRDFILSFSEEARKNASNREGYDNLLNLCLSNRAFTIKPVAKVVGLRIEFHLVLEETEEFKCLRAK